MNTNILLDPNELTIASRNMRRKLNFSGTIQNFNQTTQINSKSALTFVSRCENCKNWERLILYERKLKELTDEKEKLTKVNNYLMITITRKDEIILKLMKENKGFLAEINSYKIQVKNLSKNQFLRNNHDSEVSFNSDDSGILTGMEKKQINIKPRQSNSEHDDFFKKPNLMKRESNINNSRRNLNVLKRTESILQNQKTVLNKQFTVIRSVDDKVKEDQRDNNYVNVINNTIAKNIEIIERKFEQIKKKILSFSELNEKKEDFKEDEHRKYLNNIRELSKLSLKLTKIDRLLEPNEKTRENSSSSLKKKEKKSKKSIKNNTNNFSYKLPNATQNNPKHVEPSIPNVKHNMYDKISIIMKKNLNRKKEGNMRTSFLSMDEEALKKVPKTELIKEMYNLTLNDVDFIHAMRIFPEDKLITYCEMIGNIIKDFEKAIKVIYRLKNFLRVSNKFYNSMTANESVNILIKNACEILDCDRSTIFTYDKYTNSLILHSGEGFGRNEEKFPVDKGIIGLVFNKGERVKLDDAYLDDRFNKEVDKNTNYRTRTILCVPLKDHENNIIGVIQSINKRKGLFTTDDEEIMEIFANQASSIIKSSILNDEYFNFSSRLRYTIDYAIKLTKCSSFYDLSCLSEEVLSYYFSAKLSQILFYNKEKNCLVKVTKDENIEKKSNFGIVGYVFKHKEIIGFNNIDDSNYFNKIVDLEIGYPVLTFPILSQDDEILAITQTAYPNRLNPKTNLPRDNDFSLLQYYRNVCAVWIESNQHLLLS
jgi:hypothetical protein